MGKAMVESGATSAHANVKRDIAGVVGLMSPNTEYIISNAALTTLTLPATSNVGDVMRITGQGAVGWSIAQNALQTIHVGNVSTTVGVGGSLSSNLSHDCVTLVCTVADTEFVAAEIVGALVVV